MFSLLDQYDINSLVLLPSFGEDLSEKIAFVLFSNMNLFTLAVVLVILFFCRYPNKFIYCLPLFGMCSAIYIYGFIAL